MSAKMIHILGCTGCGKGSLGFEIARRWGGEIVSIDSMKVYRRMDVGTAKPSPERRAAVRYHLVDVVEPFESFSLGKYIELADAAIADIEGRGRPIIAVGGTAMYIKGLLEGIFDGPPADADIRRKLQRQMQQIGADVLHKRLAEVDPMSAERIHPNDTKRILRALEVYELTGRGISSFQRQFGSGKYRHDWKIIGLRRGKEDNNHRINQRVKRMVEAGLVEEVKSLLAEPKGLISDQAGQAVGYAEIIEYHNGDVSLEKAIENIKINTRHLAKHQRTWFRSFRDVCWFDLTPDETVDNLADRIVTTLQC